MMNLPMKSGINQRKDQAQNLIGNEIQVLNPEKKKKMQKMAQKKI